MGMSYNGLTMDVPVGCMALLLVNRQHNTERCSGKAVSKCDLAFPCVSDYGWVSDWFVFDEER